MTFKTQEIPEFRGIADFRSFLTWIADFFKAFSGDEPLKRKLIPIGQWDAQNASLPYPPGGANLKSIDVSDYGLTTSNTYYVRYIIFKDDGTIGLRKDYSDFFQVQGTIFQIQGGLGSDYAGNTVNRGYLIVEYI